MAIAGRVAIVPKGEWSANATYKRLDAVTYNNTLYFAKKDVPAGTATSNTEYWSRSIVGGAGAIATKEDAGIVKPADGLTVAEDGTLEVSIDGTTLTMDQVNNVIKLADTLKDKINGAFPAANLINNLTTTEAGFGLDARQGKALDDKITEINGSLNTTIKRANTLDGNEALGTTCYGKPWLVLKELFDKIPTGISVFVTVAAASYLTIAHNMGTYATFIVFCYEQANCYHVFKTASNWSVGVLQAGNYKTF
mgnify:CR=1 FL=1|uniref:Uncharacterized protein n=1 Tax=Siphoviridae sp. ctNLX12 TaxID=2825469 RepID=A0A8S5UDJ9_9CAUD|nr:MAG TPA: hypothetical protein [Siphoviridae sp. ctNLX12]